MAESDPRKLRSYAQATARRDLDSDEDPLVELARIVSEDSGFYSAKGGRAQPERAEPVDLRAHSGDHAYSGDLESELLQELETSFASRAKAAPSGARASAQPAQAAQPDDNADDLLRSIEEQLGAFERRAKASRYLASEPEEPSEHHDADWEGRAVPVGSAESGRSEFGRGAEDRDDEPIQAEPDWRDGPSRHARYDDEDVSPAPALRSVQREESFPPAEEQLDEFPSNRAASAVFGRSRPQATRHAEPPRAAEPRGRRGEPADSRVPPAASASRFAPRSGVASGAAAYGRDGDAEVSADAPASQPEKRFPRLEVPRDLRPTFDHHDETREPDRNSGAGASHFRSGVGDDREASYSTPPFASRWREAENVVAGSLADEPSIGQPSAAAYQEMPEPRRRGRKALAALVLLAVLAAGGAVAFYMRGGDEVASLPPPVIAAPEGAVKVEPPQDSEQATGETVGEAVYDRVAGGPVPPENEQVVEDAEEPQEIARIVPPAPPAEMEAAEPPSAPMEEQVVAAISAAPDAAVAAPEGFAEPDAAAEATVTPPADTEAVDETVPIGPRRVRTYVVRPDGSIAEATAGPAASDEAAAGRAEEQQVAARAEAAPIEPVRVATTDVRGGTAAPTDPVPDTAFDAEGAGEATPAAPARVASLAGETSPPAAGTSAAPADPQDDTPILPELASNDLAPNPPSPASEAAPAASDGYVVQLSSQRTEEQARSAYSNLQQRYSSVLGDARAEIRQADLGAKGIFFRVQVGPYASRAEAIEMCESLQAAGGSCFVTR